MLTHEFDVVVIGGGSAGCAAAGRFCATTDLRVCLVEAGPDYGPVAEGYWPGALLDARVRPATHDWEYSWERDDGSSVPEPRAKVIGGCSTHNQCAAVWGMPEDYDRWAAGNPGWTHTELFPFIDQVEQCAQASSAARGRRGALPTRIYQDDELSAWQRAFLSAGVAAGFPRLTDLSAPEPAQGVAAVHANVLDHTRWNASFAFLDPIRELPTLTVYDLTPADRLLIDQESVTGLICRSESGEVEVAAKVFVVAAGTYGSPAILMRSGIGPSQHLTDVGIPVVIDAPGLGENLHDHPGITLRFAPTQAARRALDEDYRRGSLYQSQVILRARSTRSAGGFDLHLLPYLDQTEAGEWEFMMLGFNMVPRSRGRVRVRGEDPAQPPIIEPFFLSDPEDHDITVLAEGLAMMRQLAGTALLANTIAAEVDPGPRVQQLPDLQTFIRRTVHGYAHPVGTCKMGPASDPLAVVDATGRVHGTSNLFVADASIMPQIPRANINLTCMLIGMKVADGVAAMLRDLG